MILCGGLYFDAVGVYLRRVGVEGVVVWEAWKTTLSLCTAGKGNLESRLSEINVVNLWMEC